MKRLVVIRRQERPGDATAVTAEVAGDDLEETEEAAGQIESQEEAEKRIRAAVMAEYEAAIDRRVNEAKRTFWKKAGAELSKNRREARKERAVVAEKYAAEMAEKDRALALKELRLDVCDLVAEYLSDFQGNQNFRDMIAYADLVDVDNPQLRYKTLKDRVLDLRHEFKRQVKIEVEKQKAGLLKR